MESSTSEFKSRPEKLVGVYGQQIPSIEGLSVDPLNFCIRDSGLIVPERLYNPSYSIFLSGDVDVEMLDTLKNELIELEESDIFVKNLNIDLASYGGEVYYGFAVYDALSIFRKEKNLSITTTSIGPVMSMAALILQVGDVRRMSANSVMLIHPITGLATGSKNEIKAESVQMDRLDKVYSEIFVARAQASGVESTTEKVLEEITNAHNGVGTYLSAQEAKKYGFVDEVI